MITPKKIASKIQSINENHGEAGYWLEEKLFGQVINISSLPKNNPIYQILLQINTWKNEKNLLKIFQNLEFSNGQQQCQDSTIARYDPMEKRGHGHFWSYSRCEVMKYFIPVLQRPKTTFNEFLAEKDKGNDMF